MSADEQKRRAAEAALGYLEPDSVVGVGTGSTVNLFIEALARRRDDVTGAVSSSRQTSERLRDAGVPVLELNEVDALPLYVDGADEVNRHLQLIKGGGGALTREKVVATACRRFVCIVDAGKRVAVLGRFPLAVEVIPMARSFVARRLAALGGQPELRRDFTTDNGNLILDVHNLEISQPIHLEREINDIPGVVANGLFALRPADVALVGTDSGVETLTR